MLTHLIHFIRDASPRAFDLLKSCGRGLGRRSPLYDALEAAIAPLGRFTFLQIGGNDGISNDPYREFMIRPQARGVTVEPVPEYFARLKSNYAAYPQVTCLNVCVSYDGGSEACLYAYTEAYLRSIGNSQELAGIAGFRRDHLAAQVRPPHRADDCIREVRIASVTVEQILARSGLDRFDCLFLDCEGHEEHVLLGMNYETVRPCVIAFEHTYFSTEGSAIDRHLQSKGFTLHRLQYDTVAVRQPT